MLQLGDFRFVLPLLHLHLYLSLVVLSELPISDSLSTVSTALNRSLLFHPRVAEEANNLLATRDDSLIGQLVNAIEQTNSDHIELKDQYGQQSNSSKSLQEGPLLLQAIHSCRPDVFNRPMTAHQQQQQLLAQQQQKLSKFRRQLGLVFCLYTNPLYVMSVLRSMH